MATVYGRADGAVNKRLLSTGENGEFASDNVGFGLNPGVERAPPQSLSSNRREPVARENLRNVADTGNMAGGGCCQQHGRNQLGQGIAGSPRNVVSNYLSEQRNKSR